MGNKYDRWSSANWGESPSWPRKPKPTAKETEIDIGTILKQHSQQEIIYVRDLIIKLSQWMSMLKYKISRINQLLADPACQQAIAYELLLDKLEDELSTTQKNYDKMINLLDGFNVFKPLSLHLRAKAKAEGEAKAKAGDSVRIQLYYEEQN